MLENLLTGALRSDPTPLSIGHASTSVVSLQSVPSVTAVGHCGSKGCTRTTLLTIFRSIRGRTTADGYRVDTVKTLLVSSRHAIT